ncbi:MAG: serine/threonine protein kinase, partial [Planctomycetes bacterium]|nr:serine/threonine protein kinase [Planctomycetota bacterium]
MKFTYRWGQRPLDGYTIKRGLGQGGFGEVYFAISDGGKEVALKLIRGHTDIELRGIANCLNLKHPNLVHLYDLRVDAQGDRWLVMEYIQGETLNTVLKRSPNGLPEAQARAWFLEAAGAVAYLHDHAVVHRDIKPANLFVENGIVKLGDYGLSKAVGPSQHAQSSNVGTIHYMAPEVAGGVYSKQIDVYACGVMLYEMLTGDVPFKGESWAEIASKHQTDLPNMSKVPAAYVSILEKALNKKADKRYADVPEMIKAVEAIGQPLAPAPTSQIVTTVSSEHRTGTISRPTTSAPIANWRGKFSELTTSLLLAPVVAAPTTAIWAIFTGSVQWGVLGALYLTMTTVSWAVLITSKTWEGREICKPRRLSMALLGVCIGAFAFWLEGWKSPEIWMQDESLSPGLVSYWGGVLKGDPGTLETLAGFAAFFGLALFMPRWWQSAERKRSDRFTLYPILAIGLWGLLLQAFWLNFNVKTLPNPPGYLVL